MSDGELLRVLGEIRRRGGIGRGDLADEVAHARQYVAALPIVSGRLIDLGSGGGLPGLVIAATSVDWRVALVERRAKRADLLRFGVAALALGARVTVHAVDVFSSVDLLGPAADVVSARSFAAPLTVLSAAFPLLRPGGLVLVSDPPGGSRRWSHADLDELRFDDLGRIGTVHRFRRRL